MANPTAPADRAPSPQVAKSMTTRALTTPPRSATTTRAVALALVLLAPGCAASAPRQRTPEEVDDPARFAVEPVERFTLWIERGAGARPILDAPTRDALALELERAREFLVAFLGPAMAPGDFRPRGAGRPGCPPEGGFGLPPPVPVIDVVVLAGDRCHADHDGVCLVPVHLPRHDATHELVHFLAGSAWHPIDEGLAVYLTERLWGPAHGVPLMTRARAFHDLGLDTDLDPDDLHEDGMSRRDYDVAGAFVGWLIETYGKERLFRLYHGPQRNYHGVYDQSEQDLLRRFWQAVRGRDVRGDAGYHRFKALVTGG